jgi:leader peptidase (prepilin peptidase) / N-methyltransferase
MTAAADTLLIVFVIAVLAVLSWRDVRARVIPNRIVLPAWAIVLVAQVVLHPGQWDEWLIASAVAAGVLLVPALVYPAGLGMGDVKLMGLIGAALGYSVLNGLLVGTLLAGLFSAALLLRYGSSARRVTFPYGPFLAAGAVAVLLV